MTDPVERGDAAYSPLATAIKRLLDETQFYDRSSWAYFCSTREEKLVNWITDKAVPRGDQLRMVVNILQRRGGAAATDGLEAFDALRDLPGSEISPVWMPEFGNTLADYLKPISLGELGRELRAMPFARQIAYMRG